MFRVKWMKPTERGKAPGARGEGSLEGFAYPVPSTWKAPPLHPCPTHWAHPSGISFSSTSLPQFPDWLLAPTPPFQLDLACL